MITLTKAPEPGPAPALRAGMSYRPATVAHHNGEPVHPGRYVIEGVRRWAAASPEVCPDVDGSEWLTDELLVCPTCGLDCT
ncbi:hypothetical protein F7Q99_36120 [Streptomyces kaniharaensis]|uniref:Uncharacterized protein n=1 Tax=Streptomyces kaniharaensis TaxID=212423 RepID=A0A6N7L3T2_9ACTN|nr:hypothetical protein [Streptomyces kaniharaensis]MQS17469.1 hypothetical protein [Streptomyces kaniharaensis]